MSKVPMSYDFEDVRRAIFEISAGIALIVYALKKQPGFDNSQFEAEITRMLAIGTEDTPLIGTLLKGSIHSKVPSAESVVAESPTRT